MKNSMFAIISLVFLISLSGCSGGRPAPDTISVSILPQKYLTERITGDLYRVSVMIPPGHSPATYEPTSRQIKDLNRSFIYFRIGYIPFEMTNMDRISEVNSGMKIVDTSRGVKLIHSDKAGEENHVSEDHPHNGIDPHLWLSPGAIKTVARNMLDALIEAAPQYSDRFNNNYNKLISDIESVDRDISVTLGAIKGRSFICFHPAWTYFARDYGLTQIPIEIEGKEPSPGHIKNIIDRAHRDNVHVVFVQKQFPVSVAGAIARDIDGRVVHVDPLTEDWLKGMKTIADTFHMEVK